VNYEAIAIIVATFMGPIFAVLVTLWREGRNELLKRRSFIFRTLMATRRIAISREHVDALNLIEVDFYGMMPVQNAYTAYIGHLRTTHPDDQVWGNTRQDLLAKLLHELSLAMRMPIGEIDLRNGGYSPRAWENRDHLEEYVVRMINGKDSVPIRIVDMPPPPPQPKPAEKVPGLDVKGPFSKMFE
jgi:hypothetical protein